MSSAYFLQNKNGSVDFEYLQIIKSCPRRNTFLCQTNLEETVPLYAAVRL